MFKFQKSKKIAVAMSGGVDSSVAAFLLKEKGADIFGLTMQAGPFHQQAAQRARVICRKLGIGHYVFDLKKIFRRKIINPFLKKYCESQTPNPCVECNARIKFGSLLERAREKGADYLATGHYVRQEKKEGIYILRKALFSKKDQSYFLHRLTQKQLSSAIFPLGCYSKEKVKKIAQNNNLFFEDQKESQDICFLPQGDYRTLLREDISFSKNSGKFKDLEGNVLGEHQGLPFYTIGQRKNLISGQKQPFYVLEINRKNNEIIIGPKRFLYKKELRFRDAHWTNLDLVEKVKKDLFSVRRIKAKIRSQHSAAQIEKIEFSNNFKEGRAEFKNLQRAITPGQSVVFYFQDRILGGGFISE